MRALFATLAVLAACNQPAERPRSAPDERVATPIAGRFIALSNTAMGVTGDAMVEAARISFGNGTVLETNPAHTIDGAEPIARGEESFAVVAVGPSSLVIELRSVASERTPPGAQALCGDRAASFVALAHDRPVTAVTFLMFSGMDAPGRDAVDSQLCGTYSYGAF